MPEEIWTFATVLPSPKTPFQSQLNSKTHGVPRNRHSSLKALKMHLPVSLLISGG